MDTLLSLTADPNVEDENGDTPLNLASHIDKDDFRKLLKAGADPLHKGKENVNAYEKYVKSGTKFTILWIKYLGNYPVAQLVSNGIWRH
jgi:ankyrin repeat protein